MLAIRQLGSTELRPTALAMGCAHIGSESDSDIEAVDAVRQALESGITLLDTDPGYLAGQSERRLGIALKGVPRDRYYLSTKVGTHPERPQDYSAEAVRWSLENSLRVLGTDFVDILLVHDPQTIEPVLEAGAALDEMLRLKQAGKVRAIGLGCREHTFHRAVIESGKADVILTYKDYTLLDQSAAIDTIPLAQKHAVGIILASVLDMGTLTGQRPDPATARRAFAMWEWGQKHGRDVRDFAIQFCLDFPINGVAMVGPATARQVEDVVRSATTPIPAELWREFSDTFGVGPGVMAE